MTNDRSERGETGGGITAEALTDLAERSTSVEAGTRPESQGKRSSAFLNPR